MWQLLWAWILFVPYNLILSLIILLLYYRNRKKKSLKIRKTIRKLTIVSLIWCCICWLIFTRKGKIWWSRFGYKSFSFLNETVLLILYILVLILDKPTKPQHNYIIIYFLIVCLNVAFWIFNFEYCRWHRRIGPYIYDDKEFAKLKQIQNNSIARRRKYRQKHGHDPISWSSNVFEIGLKKWLKPP